MSVERNKLRVDIIDNANHSRHNIITRDRNIKQLESKIDQLNQQEGARRGRGKRINYAALNSGNDSGNVPEDAITKADLEKQLQEETKAKSELEKETQELEKSLEDLDKKTRTYFYIRLSRICGIKSESCY